MTSLAQKKPFPVCKVIIKTNMLLAIVSLLSIEGTLSLTGTDSNTVNQWNDRTDRNFSQRKV